MSKIEIKSLIGQNGESLGAYVDYGDFCKMQSEYEEQIEKMKCCSNCKWFGDCSNDAFQNGYTFSTCSKCNNWELAE